MFVLGGEVVRGVGHWRGGGGGTGGCVFGFLVVPLKGWFSRSVLSFP